MSSAEAEDTEGGVKAIYILTWVDLATYSALLLFGTRNTAKILVMQGKWRMFYLTMFYVCSFVVVISKLVFLSITLYALNLDDEKEVTVSLETVLMVYNVANYTSFYSSVILGIFQLGTMNELSIKLMQAAMKMTNRRAKNKLNKN